ncbi:TetR/AcrR family transcriptional regulator [Anaerobacillus isosaccharinicus]|uniref:TetR family transcriptional regulator n=1 Tax=Anaerobacillus isosaccharinicus TaxID=1532552 RepID=A0A1S2MGK2_9BACI|nr:TetR/AcrR family transcriptional regulator [Anaerobacillus isosaccharinicus]MBA5587882.1 TetR/AcrR family transcriptional regulator [Anaerobacillus isosaccharinicus]QOY33965.1 TetR/AcrR family transcriptional regulator [Anaerobacillus isosaccharinicus]
MNESSFSKTRCKRKGKNTLAKRRGQKYEQIIEAAVKVIAQNGYHHSQVSKIAKEAGVADGTIYLYFKNKEDILVSLFQEKMGKFIQKIEDELAGESSIEEKLLVLITMHLQQLQDDYSLAIVTQLELRQSNLELRNRINEVLKGYLKLIDTVILLGIEEGIFSEDIDVRIARQMIFGTIDEVVTNWVMKEHKYNLVLQAKPVHGLLLKALTK